MRHFFRLAKVYRAWAFYRQQLMVDAYEKGHPIIRHMIINFPNSIAVHNANLTYQQFMLGSELLVAPVTTKNATFAEVFLPLHTEWIHVWTNKTMQGWRGTSTMERNSSNLISISCFRERPVRQCHCPFRSALCSLSIYINSGKTIC